MDNKSINSKYRNPFGPEPKTGRKNIAKNKIDSTHPTIDQGFSKSCKNGMFNNFVSEDSRPTNQNKNILFSCRNNESNLKTSGFNVQRTENYKKSHLPQNIQNKSTNFSKNELTDEYQTSDGHKKDVSISDSLVHHNSLEETRLVLSREEIVNLRKIKVAARKRLKKAEKLKSKGDDYVGKAEKPEFSLEQAAEDFPALNSGNKPKKIQKCAKIVDSNCNMSLLVDESKKNIEKSWKPKIKDPICINIGQALKSVTEKSKPAVKKVDSHVNKNITGGNILDADNPQRKRGKVRPDKVRKPSKLKSCILSERNERKKHLSSDNHNDFSLLNTQSSCNNEETSELSVNSDIESKCSITSCSFTEKSLIQHSKNNVLIQTCEIPETQEAIKNIHSRRFREYCTNCLTEDVVSNVCSLLEKVAYFQDRTFARDPIKANAKRRYVAGINQSNKYLNVKKVKLLIIAPDLEKNPGTGGLDEKINHFKKEAECQGVPYVFGPNRKQLGRAVKKSSLVSCVAVLSYEGAEEHFTRLMEALEEAKSKYKLLTGYHHETDIEKENCSRTEVNTTSEAITSSLLATLREEMSSSDRLLNALQSKAWGAVQSKAWGTVQSKEAWCGVVES